MWSSVLARMGFEPAVIQNMYSNPRDLAANERNFLTAVRMICGLIAVTAALLLKFRFKNESLAPLQVDYQPTGDSGSFFARYTREFEGTDQNLIEWARLLGFIPGSQGGAEVSLANDTSRALAETDSPLLEQNRVAVPLGICVFAICVFILVTSTYGYSQTHMQLADGRAFAGSWKLEGSMTIVLAALLFMASVALLTVGRIST